ncbi:hypothetical protein [Nonomuraea pusilla]|uniref:hypothetical protein n=2 Tax=Nonomuraea pusilla TaxID=46177 RepID=UPI003321567E
MMRRILAAAAIAGFAFGVPATAASADVGPNPTNSGTQVLGQLSALADATVGNNLLGDSLNDFDALSAAHLERINLNVLNNG